MDIFTNYSFGESLRMLDDEAKAFKWRETIIHIMKALPIVRSFPLMARLAPLLPTSVARVVTPDLSVLMEWKNVFTLHLPSQALANIRSTSATK